MESKQLKSSEEEIDLVYYFGKFRDGANKAKEIFLHYLRIIWKNIFLFLLMVLVVTGAFFFLRYIIPPSYRTNGLFISHYLPANYYGLMVQNIDRLLDKKNLPTVAEQLQISPEVASQIMRIHLKPLRDTLLDRNDTIFAPFEVTLLLSDMKSLESIQDGLLMYLEGGKNVLKEKREKRKSLEVAKEVFYEKMKKEDSMAVGAGSPGLVPVVKSNDMLFSSPWPSNYQKFMQVDKMIGELDKIEVVQPFLKRSTPNYPDYNKYLLYGFLISLLLAMIITPLVGRKW